MQQIQLKIFKLFHVQGATAQRNVAANCWYWKENKWVYRGKYTIRVFFEWSVMANPPDLLLFSEFYSNAVNRC